MATFIETKSNQIIVDQAIASGDYINLNDGYIPNYGSEFNLTFSGTQLYIGTGMLTQNGVKVINDAPMIVEVGTSATGTVTKKVYLKIDMSNPTVVEAVVSASTATLPKADIFSLYENGVTNVEIGTFTLNSGGVGSTAKTVQKSALKTEKKYSLTEQRTGETWIDGKVMYEITVAIGTLTLGQQKTFSMPQIAQVISITGFFTASNENKTTFAMNYGDSGNAARGCRAFFERGLLIVETGAERVVSSGYVILSYLKN